MKHLQFFLHGVVVAKPNADSRFGGRFSVIFARAVRVNFNKTVAVHGESVVGERGSGQVADLLDPGLRHRVLFHQLTILLLRSDCVFGDERFGLFQRIKLSELWVGHVVDLCLAFFPASPRKS